MAADYDRSGGLTIRNAAASRIVHSSGQRMTTAAKDSRAPSVRDAARREFDQINRRDSPADELLSFDENHGWTMTLDEWQRRHAA